MTARVAILTRAQRRVLGQLTHDGASNPVIADRLGLSVDTVKSHMRAILRATECRDRAAVVAVLMRGEVVVRTVRKRRSGEAA